MSKGLKVGSRDLLGVASKLSGFGPIYHLRTTPCSFSLKPLPNQTMFVLLETVHTFTAPTNSHLELPPPPLQLRLARSCRPIKTQLERHLLPGSFLVTRTVTGNAEAPGKDKDQLGCALYG